MTAQYYVLHTADTPFPPTNRAHSYPNGLLAIGGDLTTQRLLDAYSKGIFPWFNPGEPVLWWTPEPRCILRTDRIHISKSLHKVLRKGAFTVTFDRAFDDVIKACSEPRRYTSETWIHSPMIEAYSTLHRLGYAHSIEVWRDDFLVGGLYGVAIGKIFFGESMFSRETNASKVAITYLAGQLHQWGFPLIDCQVTSDHLLSLGAEEITRKAFEKHLLEYKVTGNATGPWVLNWQYGDKQ